VPSVHQFVPTFEPGAVGAHMLQVRRVLREMGLGSEIFAEHFRGGSEGTGHDYRSYGRTLPAERGDVLVYQMAIGSVVADFVLSRPETVVVDYHNITPERFFEVWEPPLIHGLAWGRRQLRDLGARSPLGLAVSEFNRQDLDEAGFGRTAVLPILFDPTELDVVPDEQRFDELMATKAAGGTDLLFVGRVAPNKCQHDLIKALAAYRRLYDPQARLHLVGGSSSPAYWTALQRYARHLDLAGAVHLHGSVPPGALAAHYRAADAFVCLSEHEGFCVPLLEAWHHRRPVVAFAAAAIPETLSGAGVMLPSKSPATVAAAVQRVLTDAPLRDRIVAAGTDRLGDFSLARTEATLRKVVEELLGSPRR
jgi:glycosyltransferase involved in cell wall biosynthesis